MGRLYETSIKLGAVIAANFRGVMGGASGALKNLGAEAAKLTSANASTIAFSRLQLAVALAEDRFKSATDAEAALSRETAAAGKPAVELARKQAAAAKATKAAEGALRKEQAALSGAGAALRAAGVDTAHLSAESARLSAALAVTERRTAALASVEKARSRLFGARKEKGESAPLIPKIGSQIGGLASDAMKLAAVGGGAAVALAALAHRTVEAGDEIGDAAVNLGLSTTALQELRFAAERGGSSVEDFDKGFAKFNQTAGDALSGNAAARKSFAELHISMRALKAASPEERFNLMADAVGKIADPAMRAAAASNFLGKTSKSMVGFLADGSKGIAELRAQSVGVLSPQAIANASKAKDAMQSAGGAFRGVGNILGAELLPVATRVLERFTRWVTENQGAIQAWAKRASAWIEGKMIPALEKLGPKVLDLATKIGGLVKGAVDLAGGMGNVGIAAAALRLAPLAWSIGNVGVQAWKATAGLIKYIAAKWSAVAAAKALNAAESGGGPSVPGAGGKGLGSKLGQAGMVVGAGVAGFEVGQGLAAAADEQFQVLDRLSAAQDRAAKARTWTDAASQGTGILGVWAKWRADNDAMESANAAAFLRANHPASLSTARGTGAAMIHFAPTINVQGASSREELERQLDEGLRKSKAAALEAFDARETTRRRGSFQ